MEENEQNKGQTSPPDPTHEAATPPGQGEVDEEALRESEKGLEQAGGGH